jgi:DNA-directed RNA polymerase specialized sigma24 family protein
MTISIKMLSDRQREAWVMRYRYGWRLKKIALKMGISQNCVSRLLVRAMLRAGLPRRRHVRIIRTKPRLATVVSLSDVVEQV